MGQGNSLSSCPWCPIEDKFEIDSRRGALGCGSIGIVWRARDRKDRCRVVALKVQEKQKMDALGVLDSDIELEVEMMRVCFGHQWFVQVKDFFQDASAFYLVLEYCDCGTLASAVKEGRTVGVDKVRIFTGQLLQGIAFLHEKKICHRDVKPQNIMIANTSHVKGRIAEAVKLGDFGLAVYLEPGTLIKEKVGTPAFMAPELQLLPKYSVGYEHAVDVWAAGCVLVFLLSHEYAFLDADGHVIMEELLRGDLPIWNRSVFGSLFTPGAYAKKPAPCVRELVQRLLAPSRQTRVSAAAALKQEWFWQPIGFDHVSGDTSPVKEKEGDSLLRWEDFQGVPDSPDNKPVRLVLDKMGNPLPVHKHMPAGAGSPLHAQSPRSSPNLLQALFYNGM